MPSAGQTYAKILGRNISAARGYLQMSQTSVAERMRQLGFEKWHQQTVANVEKGTRPVKAEEIHALALTLRTTVLRLVTPAEHDRWISLPNGREVHAISVTQVGAAWNGNVLAALAGDAGWVDDGSADPLKTAAAIAARHPDNEAG